MRNGRGQDGARACARRLGPAAAAQCAMVVLEPVRGAGGVLAEPAGQVSQTLRARSQLRKLDRARSPDSNDPGPSGGHPNGRAKTRVHNIVIATAVPTFSARCMVMS